MSDNIVELDAHYKMSVQEALEVAERTPMQKVILIYYDHEGDIQAITSEATCEEVLWMLKKIENHLLRPRED